MSELILKAEDISKHYQLGVTGSLSLKQDLQNLFFKGGARPEDEIPQHIWALKDINFELRSGEVMGIVGHNGSGKSTLLKILSRIARPTTGSVRWKGKISSLLEIGTGFHAELTGRENIYLNGQILGLSRQQVKDRFDEIVDFSGIEAFLDTPVKRYSSGMYVRLAFSVAAFLKSDILIIDEVLAVGDIEFQTKCISKMKDISRLDGKSILFVSHDMHIIRSLCTKGIYLEKGRTKSIGIPDKVIAEYLNLNPGQSKHNYLDAKNAPGNSQIKIKKISWSIDGRDEATSSAAQAPVIIDMEFWYSAEGNGKLSLGLMLYNELGQCIFDLFSTPAWLENGLTKATCAIPGNFLNEGHYTLCISFSGDENKLIFDFPECLSIHIQDTSIDRTWYGRRVGLVRPEFPIHLQHIEERGKI